MLAKRIEKYAARRLRSKEKWVEENIRPRLIQLLNRAQLRLRCTLQYADGQGTDTFWLGDRYADRHKQQRRCHLINFVFTQAFRPFCSKNENPKIDRIRARMPELVEFSEIIDSVNNELGYEFGIIEPTNKPQGQAA